MHLPPISTILPLEPQRTTTSTSPNPRKHAKPNKHTHPKQLQHNSPRPPPPASIASATPLPNHLHRLTLLTLANTTTPLLLKQPPNPRTPLLRHEHHLLASSTAILTHLSQHPLPPSLPIPIPHLLHASPSPHPALLTTFLPGLSPSLLFPPLTPAETHHLTQTLHALSTTLATTYTSTTFGPAHLVASPRRGHATWSGAFGAMLEALLMDAEDGTVNLPYAAIRAVVRRRRGALDKVRVPRLVVPGLRLGVGREGGGGVLVEREGGVGKGRVRVSGMVGWGKAVWGDGEFGAGAGGEEGEGLCGEGEERERRACYLIFWAVGVVVRGHYRPGDGESELDARKVLTKVLGEMMGREQMPSVIAG